MITQFDRAVCKSFRTQLEQVLKPFAHVQGVTITGGGARFTHDRCTLKLEITVNGANGQAVNPYEADYKAFGASYGLKPQWLNKPFSVRGKTFTLVGLKSSSRKYPVVGRSQTGKLYRLPAQDVLDFHEAI